MPDWIAKANIEHFKKLLEAEKDPERRAVIQRDLAEEEAKVAELLKKQNEPKKRGRRRPIRANALDGQRPTRFLH